MKTKIFLFSLLALTLQSFAPVVPIPSATVHVVMFIENDRSEPIYQSCQTDARLFKEELRIIGNYTGMKIKYYPTSFTKGSAKDVIANLNCGSDDVVLFYYNGHGYNNGKSNFPCLNFHEPSFASDQVNLEDLHTKLKAKGARLTLTIGDCCNVVAGKYYTPLTDKRKRALQYINLFKASKGDALIASSEKGQYSYVYRNGSGSYFTLNFLDAIHEAVESGNANWGYILEQTQKKATATSKGSQVPCFKENTQLIWIGNTHEK